jgi:HrpA-like RNA helicase
MVLAAVEEDCVAEVLVIASALAVQDPRERPMDKAAEADAAHAPFRDEQSDFVSYLKLWAAFHDRQKHLSGSKLRKWCQASFVSWVRMREWHDVHAQLKEVTGELGLLNARRAGAAAAGQPVPAASPAVQVRTHEPLRETCRRGPQATAARAEPRAGTGPHSASPGHGRGCRRWDRRLSDFRITHNRPPSGRVARSQPRSGGSTIA